MVGRVSLVLIFAYAYASAVSGVSVVSPRTNASFLRARSDSQCDSIAKFATGALAATAVVHLVPPKPGVAIPDEFASHVAEAIGAHLVLPKPLDLSVYASTDTAAVTNAPRADQVHPGFSSEFLVTFRKDGSVRKIEMTQTSLMPRLDDAIGAAINSADSAHDFPSLNAVTDAATLAVFLDFDLRPGSLNGGFPVFHASVPLYSGQRAQQLPGREGVPRYPDELRRSGVQGEARFRFVVDEEGRVAKGTYRILKMTHGNFGQSIVDALPKMRFKAAHIGACPIKQIAEQSFMFRLDNLPYP